MVDPPPGLDPDTYTKPKLGPEPERGPHPNPNPKPDPNPDPKPGPNPGPEPDLHPHPNPNPSLVPDPNLSLTLTPAQPDPNPAPEPVPGALGAPRGGGSGGVPTFQKTVSKSVPWNFSGMPEVDSLGPSNVTNSSKSTCPSPAGHGGDRHTPPGLRGTVTHQPPGVAPSRHPPWPGAAAAIPARDLTSQGPPPWLGTPRTIEEPTAGQATPKTSWRTQLQPGTSRKVRSAPTLARMPSPGCGPQGQLGTPNVSWGPPNPTKRGPQPGWGPPTEFGVPKPRQGAQRCLRYPVPAGDPRGGCDRGGGRHRPCPAGAGAGAVRPALTMSDEGSGGLAAPPERLLNGGGKETNKLTSSFSSARATGTGRCGSGRWRHRPAGGRGHGPGAGCGPSSPGGLSAPEGARGEGRAGGSGREDRALLHPASPGGVGTGRGGRPTGGRALGVPCRGGSYRPCRGAG